MKKIFVNLTIGLVIIILLNACNNSESNDKTTKDSSMKDKKEPTAANWVSLFDGKTFAGWHNFNGGKNITSWAIEDSSLVCLGTAKDAHGGDIASDNDYENFELSWEWKVDKGSNSGVMYHVVEDATFGYRAAAPALLCIDSYNNDTAITWNPEKMQLVKK